MTLDDIDSLNGRNVTLVERKQFYAAYHNNLNEDRSILSAAKCSSMLLVFRNIRYYMLIFAGVPRGGASNTIILPYTCVQIASAVL